MTSLTTIDIQRTERLVSAERKRVVGRAAWTAFFFMEGAFNLVVVFAFQDNMPGVRIANSVAGIVMLGGFALATAALLDSKLKHAELLAELMRLRPLHDKDY